MKLLIICLPGVGDSLLYTPAIHSIKKKYPHCSLEVLVMFKGAAQLYEKNPQVNKIHYFPFIQKGIIKSFKFLYKLRKEKYDVSILAYTSNRMEYNIIHFLIGAEKRYGHSYLHRDFLSFTFLNQYRVKENNQLHNVEENFSLLKEFDSEIETKGNLNIYLDHEEISYGDIWLQENRINANQLIIGFHAGTAIFKNHIKRRWPKENFIELGKMITESLKGTILLFGGPDEEELNRKIAEGIGESVHIVKGTTMRQTAALMKKCKVMVSNDSALMHVAAAIKTPVVCIFGPTNPVWVKPYHSLHKIVSLNLPCSPCFYYSVKPLSCKAKLDYYCVKGISVKRVYNETVLFINEINKGLEK